MRHLLEQSEAARESRRLEVREPDRALDGWTVGRTEGARSAVQICRGEAANALEHRQAVRDGWRLQEPERVPWVARKLIQLGGPAHDRVVGEVGLYLNPEHPVLDHLVLLAGVEGVELLLSEPHFARVETGGEPLTGGAPGHHLPDDAVDHCETYLGRELHEVP